MLPTLSDGDRLLVRLGGRAEPGALVIVRLPGGRPVAVKRLLGRQPDGIWVERDNPMQGVDSWQVGPLGLDDLLGVVRWRLWPRPRRFTGGTASRGPHDRGVA